MLHPETRSLLAKEWRERRTAFFVCTGWMLCCAVYAATYETAYRVRAPIATYFGSSHLYLLFAAVFLAMQTAVGERTRGTLGFSLALPVARKRLAWWRLVGGGLTLVTPIVVGALVLMPLLALGWLEHAALRQSWDYVQLPLRPSLTAIDAVKLLWTTMAVATASGLQLYLVLSIFGTRCRSEAPIGFAGAVLAFVWLACQSARMTSSHLNGWFGALSPASLIINYGYGGENGSYSDLDLGAPLWRPLVTNAAISLLLAWWFVCRYGVALKERSKGAAWRWPAIWSRLPFTLPNELSALVWLNLRQSVPLALAGLVLAALMTATATVGFENEGPFRSQLPSHMWFVAMLWAAVVGVGVFAAELRPPLLGFWRSRPIGVRWWFWCKFLVGLAAMLLVLDGVTIWYSWGTPIDHTSGLSWSYIACVPILHATLYAVAVFGVCQFRRPILGGTLAIAGFGVASILLSSFANEPFEPINVHNQLLSDEMQGQFALARHHYPLVYGTLVVIGVACAVLASRAIGRPDSRQSWVSGNGC